MGPLIGPLHEVNAAVSNLADELRAVGISASVTRWSPREGVHSIVLDAHNVAVNDDLEFTVTLLAQAGNWLLTASIGYAAAGEELANLGSTWLQGDAPVSASVLRGWRKTARSYFVELASRGSNV